MTRLFLRKFVSPVGALSQVAVLLLSGVVHAQAPVDAEVIARIRAQAEHHSHILQTIEVLTDLYGPRLTGSPNLKAAGEWAVERMVSWGLRNGRLEPWDWGRVGWTNERVSAHIIEPVKDQLTVEVVAWTPGTLGSARARAVQLIPPEDATSNELDVYLRTVQQRVRDQIVLVGAHAVLPVDLEPPDARLTGARVRDDMQSDGRVRIRRQERRRPGALPPGQVSRRIDDFLVTNGALVRVNDAARELGQIAVFQNPTYDLTKAVPTVVMRNEDYGRISRLLASGQPVELEFDIVNHVYPEGRTSYNAVAEIPGSDLAHEIVMIGGHLDAWHAATGATDNAAGCAVMMEVGRILATLSRQPRRTIRLALWSGEEQGLLGSRAYVAEHFGSFEKPKPDYGNLSAYLNLDTGTGRPRGASVFGPPEAAAVIGELLAPFEDLGVIGASPNRRRSTGQTDHTVFNQAGLPGINFTQDPIQYDSHTHHTNLDTYERILEDDLKAAAVVIASTVYHLAMRDEKLPRFSGGDMPAPPQR